MSAYSAYGLTSQEDAAYAGAFEAWAKDRGWSSKEIESTFAWYADEGSKQTSSDDVLTSYHQHCNKIGLAAEHEIAASEWMIGAAQSGPEPPPLPSAQEDATRAHEIRDLMRTDPDSYWRDKSLQRELHQIIERQSDFEDEATAIRPAATAQRKNEIEQIMGEDIDRYYSEGLDKELSNILRAEAGQQGAGNDTDGTNNSDGGEIERDLSALADNNKNNGGNDNGNDD